MNNDLSFCELRRLEVINGSDGRRLGHIIDMIFSTDGRVKGVILPYGRRGVFSKSQDLFIPFACLQKIGEDVIIVEINDLPGGNPTCVPVSQPERLPPPAKPPNRPKSRTAGETTATASAKSVCSSTAPKGGMILQRADSIAKSICRLKRDG